MRASNNPIERLKTEKLGLELLKEFPRLAATPVAELCKDDQQRIKWLGFWQRDTDPPTLMQRIRIPGGVASSAQLRVMAGIARDFGRDLVDITTRQQVQLRWLDTSHIPEVYQRLRGVGLSSLQNGMDSIRNVVTSSVAGLCDLEILDARPIVAAVSDWITNNHEGNAAVANLPRKVNVHITGHPHDMGACSNDIGLYPARNGEDLGFNVMVGGAVGGKHPRLADDLDVFVLPKDVLGVVRGIIEVFHEHGPREERHKSRLKWLLAEWGDQKFRAELERHLGHTLLRGGQDLRVHGTPRLPLGVNAQKQTGLVYIGAHVPVGRSNAQALYDLADLVDKHGNGEARFTIEQNILVPNIPEASLGAALAHPFFVAHTPFPHATEEGVVSCTGIEFCPFALIETKSRALEVAQLLKQEFMQALPLAEAPRMHWSGCQHACASHHIGDFGFQGTKARVDGQMVDAVDVYIGGRIGRCAQLGEKILDRVPIAALPQKIVELTRTHLPHLLQTPVLAASSDD